MITIKLFLFLFFWRFTNSQDQCIIERTQSPGQCKLLEECPAVIEDYKRRRKHTRCGFQGRREIVCCPIQQITSNVDPVRLGVYSRLHEKKCHEYQSAVHSIVFSMGLAIGADKKQIEIDNCGHKIVPLIVGGIAASSKEFPHMALLGYESKSGEITWACGATLISERFVITAAHCLNSKRFGEPKYVKLGELDRNSTTDDAKPEDFIITDIISHPEYTKFTKYNDIALLKLHKDVKLNPYIRPACLPSDFDTIDTRAIASGWGVTEYGGTESSYLQKVILDKFSQTECSEIYSGLIDRRLSNGIQEKTQICAGSKDASKDTCQGDSGGPLQVYHRNEYCMYIVIGVTSFGFRCGEIGVPGIYTRVYNYVDWIERTIWPGERL